MSHLELGEVGRSLWVVAVVTKSGSFGRDLVNVSLISLQNGGPCVQAFGRAGFASCYLACDSLLQRCIV